MFMTTMHIIFPVQVAILHIWYIREKSDDSYESLENYFRRMT